MFKDFFAFYIVYGLKSQPKAALLCIRASETYLLCATNLLISIIYDIYNQAGI